MGSVFARAALPSFQSRIMLLRNIEEDMAVKSSKVKKRQPNLTDRSAKAEAEELDALNARARRETDTVRLIEASIEAKAEKRRSQEAPASASWKSST